MGQWAGAGWAAERPSWVAGKQAGLSTGLSLSPYFLIFHSRKINAKKEKGVNKKLKSLGMGLFSRNHKNMLVP